MSKKSIEEELVGLEKMIRQLERSLFNCMNRE